MNFDFLKDIKSLAFVYRNCNNAEELANTYPDSSLVASRRGAEALARMIYLAAHKEEMEHMTFDSVLKDQAVRRFIHNRDVMDAFYNIKQKGNKGAHVSEEEELTSEDAIEVLWDLHYVAGETALRMNLVDAYPEFDDNIGNFPNAKVLEEENIEEKVMEMFLEYAQQYNAEMERANYYIPNDEEFWKYVAEGHVDLHERLIFDAKPKTAAMVEYLQQYLLNLYILSVERSPEIAEAKGFSGAVTLNIKIYLDGHEYTSDDLEDYINTLNNRLPNANSIIVDNRCKGKLREIYYDEDGEYFGPQLRKDRIWNGYGMLDKLESFKRQESFSYSMIQFLPDSGNVGAAAIINGKSKGIRDLMDERLLDNKEMVLDCDGFTIMVVGNKKLIECPELFEELKTIVRDNIYEESLEYCEDVWDPNSEDYIENCIIPFTQIKHFTVGEYETFLNKLNKCLEPWEDVLSFYVDEPNLYESIKNDSSNILYDLDNMVIGVVEVVDGKLHIVGTTL